ncbi:helix-turn-helix domain containing protein [Streptomyces niveiscabiei]|uniref:TetR/AcrR family transcriptional regulator n=1 Tax=Streptomyces niveiscabiei TaxID=164115 RepID=UPI0029A3E2FB|nr:helix-turn-helix domain-containing protein [Streptomyces niveiscabiei]MDX3384621.1 helix-turn-helix domain containing protein [Streptomyces niveiscabiei]
MTSSEDQRSPDSPRPVGRPRRIDPARIVEAARRVLEEEGVEALSMRRIAREVGATPMALYHHVRDKDELLMLALAGLAAQIPRPVLPEAPRDRVLVTALHMYTALGRFPWAVEVLGMGDLTDKGALWMPEEIIASCIAHGRTREQAVHTYRTLWYYVYGALRFRAAESRRARQSDRRPFFPDLLTPEDAGELPHLTSMAADWQELTRDYDVAEQLRALVNGLLPEAT